MFYTFAVAFEHGASTAGMLTYLSKFKHVTTCTSFLVQAVVFQPNSAQIEQDDYLKIEILLISILKGICETCVLTINVFKQ